MKRAPRRLCGTDGIRGPAGEGPLAPEALLALGRSAAAALRPGARVLLGRDTRPSGPMVAGAFAAGLQAGGASVHDGGVLPTPAVALLVRRGRYDLGVAVSASHNPAGDNGLKLLGPDGEKVPDAFERAVERGGSRKGRPGTGRLRPGAAEEYAAAVIAEFRGLSLRGMRVVVDAGEGAASDLAPSILRRLGAAVRGIRCGGDGARINDGCGALHPDSAGRAVRRHRAHLGIALDGDADRVALLDERGAARDGDDVLAALAPRLKSRRRLPGDAVVGTVMTNGGLDAHLARHGIRLRRVPVGDRFVAAEMRERNLALGAEPSGHVLLPREGGLLTSDGLVTALFVLREMAHAGRPLSGLLLGFRRHPRAEAAVRVARKPALTRVPAIRAAIAAVDGRTVVRYSGTEPKLRILVEAATQAAADRGCARIARAAEVLR